MARGEPNRPRRVPAPPAFAAAEWAVGGNRLHL